MVCFTYKVSHFHLKHNHYYTVMWSTNKGSKSKYEFSSDDYNGDSTHDNARRINETKGVVANYNTGGDVHAMEGDVQVNGAYKDHVSIEDALLLRQYLADPAGSPLTADQQISAETWEEGASAGKIDITDALVIQKWLADDSFELWKSAYDSGVTVPPAP